MHQLPTATAGFVSPASLPVVHDLAAVGLGGLHEESALLSGGDQAGLKKLGRDLPHGLQILPMILPGTLARAPLRDTASVAIDDRSRLCVRAEVFAIHDPITVAVSLVRTAEPC